MFPQAPQLAGSASKLTSQPSLVSRLQFPKPGAHPTITQAPASQAETAPGIGHGEHPMPHPKSGSSTFTHVPLHFFSSLVHVTSIAASLAPPAASCAASLPASCPAELPAAPPTPPEPPPPTAPLPPLPPVAPKPAVPALASASLPPWPPEVPPSPPAPPLEEVDPESPEEHAEASARPRPSAKRERKARLSLNTTCKIITPGGETGRLAGQR